MTSSGEDNRAATEAAHWLVALDDDPTDLQMRVRFQAWLDASAANGDAWRDTADIVALARHLPAEYESHWKPIQDRKRAGRSDVLPSFRQSIARFHLSWSRQTLFGALFAGIAACLVAFNIPTLLLRIEADEITSAGEQRAVALEDGTMVRMGPDSAFSAAFGDAGRGVRLLKGEVFLEVAPDPRRPFRVAAGAVETTVLGTAFDVRLESHAVSVAVQHGRVQVEVPSAAPRISERLEAGEWTRVTWSGEVAGGQIRPEDVAAWMSGQIVAQDRALADVVDDLRRFYRGLIIVTDEALEEQRVTGVYKVSDPLNALRAVAGAYGGRVRQVSPWILIVSGP
jgi:transmembrane sensor